MANAGRDLVTERLKEVVQDLNGLKDELQVQASLGGKEAQEAWGELKRYLDPLVGEWNSVQQRFEGLGEQANLDAHLALMELRERWEGLRGELSQFAARLRNQEQKGYDLARLKAHLARLDAEEVVLERLREIRNRLSSKDGVDVLGTVGLVKKSAEDLVRFLKKSA